MSIAMKSIKWQINLEKKTKIVSRGNDIKLFIYFNFKFIRMNSYGYQYGGPYGPVPPDVVYPDHGDGLYYPPVSTDLSDDR